MAGALQTYENLLSRTTVTDNGCWEWQGFRDKDGYGISSFKHRPARAHRLAWQFARGPIPDGLVIDHLCRNKACCNPDHLEPVTVRENTIRGDTILARNLAKTHCDKGHPLDGDNLYADRRGWRGCRACRKEASQRQLQKRRA